MKNILIFGSSGSIGSFIVKRASEKYTVFASRHVNNGSTVYFTDEIHNNFMNLPQLDAVVWAHGINVNDSIGQVVNFEHVVNVNLTYTVKTLDWLVKNKKLCEGARLCIISSIWQNTTRPNKFSYTVSKSALKGLVTSAAVDLKKSNVYINAILPGPVDNEMTRGTLTHKQIESIGQFVTLDEIWNLVEFLCFVNTGITGQNIVLDHGFSTGLKF